jgi:hypothetical protein
MNKPVRMAFRNTLAVGITLFATEVYPNPVAVRGLLCASLVSALPTFRRAAMRQRFILMWMAAGIGMLSEVLFRDALWFFIPFYFALVSLVFYIGSKSRDTATLIIIAYGLSGSLLNKFPGSGNEPVFDGFFRAFWCSVGLLAGVFSFLVFPIPKAPLTARVRPVNFPVRDCIYLGICSVVSLVIGVAATQYLSSPFLVMVTLVWGITLCTQRDKSALPMTFVFAIFAVIVAVAFDSVIASSTNNLMVFLAAFLAIVWLVNWLRFAFASITPMLSFFLIVFLAGAGMSPMPFQSFNFTLSNLFSVLGGIVVASVLWVIDQVLRSVELAAEQSSRKKIPC